MRVNNGGNDLFYIPLLPYIFNETLYFTDLFEEDEVMYTNYTKANCELMVQTLKEYIEQEEDPGTMKLLREDIQKLLLWDERPWGLWIISMW